jgi:ubiquinone biosynthesis protein Coq4
MPETFNFNDFYSEKINELTLQDALDLHYKLNPQFTHWSKYDTEAARYMIKNHDISHIIFGCDTSYPGEYCVQTWVKFGCQLNIKPQKLFGFLFNKDLIQIVLPPKLIQYSLTHLAEFKQFEKEIKLLSSKQTKKWQYGHEENYMNKTVGEIRKEYNIKLKIKNL